jgi:hypothetical protein
VRRKGEKGKLEGCKKAQGRKKDHQEKREEQGDDGMGLEGRVMSRRGKTRFCSFSMASSPQTLNV